jgi:hypothetical protein
MSADPRHDHARQKFFEAITVLAIAEGDVRKRLVLASQYLIALKDVDLPEDLREDFHWVWRQLTRFGNTRSEGNVAHTMRRVRRSTGSGIAKRVFTMFCQLCEPKL